MLLRRALPPGREWLCELREGAASPHDVVAVFYIGVCMGTTLQIRPCSALILKFFLSLSGKLLSENHFLICSMRMWKKLCLFTGLRGQSNGLMR